MSVQGVASEGQGCPTWPLWLLSLGGLIWAINREAGPAPCSISSELGSLAYLNYPGLPSALALASQLLLPQISVLGVGCTHQALWFLPLP